MTSSRDEENYFLKKSSELRIDILNMIITAKKGHIGGAYSCLDILVTLYYGNILNLHTNNLDSQSRNRCILSKGHSAIAQYVIFADLGFFEKKELYTFNSEGSFLGEHPDKNIPGIEVDTGSLGHGLGIGAGMALGSKINNIDNNIYVIIGDGELYEGSTWESILFASQHKLNNLVVIVDRNKQITLDYTEECNELEPLLGKFQSFNFDVNKVDGHDHLAIKNSILEFQKVKNNKPKVLIADTIKGRGISFMERTLKWHHGLPNEEEIQIGMKELEGTINNLND